MSQAIYSFAIACEIALIEALNERRDFSVLRIEAGQITRLNDENYWITY